MARPLNDLKYKARRLLILGTSGTGKTELCARCVALSPTHLKILYDWQGAELHTKLGGHLSETREDFIEALERGEPLICFCTPEAEANEDEGAEFQWFCNVVFEAAGYRPERKLIVIDEHQDLCSPHDIPPGLTKLLTRGRRRRMDTILIGSAANAIHNTGRNQVSELACFRASDDNALVYPKGRGLDVEEIKSLDDGQFIFKNLREKGEHKKLDLFARNSKES